MKVLFLTKYYPPAEGGIERYGQLLCTGLVARGVQVVVVAFAEGGRPGSWEWADGVRVCRLTRHLNWGSAPCSANLPGVVRRLTTDCDLVHLNYPNPWVEAAHLLLGHRRRTVVSYHSDIGADRWLRPAYLPFTRLLLRRSARVLVSNPHYLDSSEVLRPLRGRCALIPYPVDLARLDRVSPGQVETCRRTHGRFVLFAGRLVHYKGVEFLIRALAELPADIQLLIVGRGPQEPHYRALAAAAGHADRVRFMGRLDDDELYPLYHACMCFVLPSTSRLESFGIVLAEAMACGAPVVSTDLGTGTSHVNSDGETGYVVPPGDAGALARAIGRIAGDGGLAAALGRRGRQRAHAFFSPQAVVEATLGVYAAVHSVAVPPG